MTLSSGTRLGPYEILAPLGAGGMGEVYRARDTRLGREVAVKVLPEEFSANRERLARFEQEARAASALSHPNILTVFDFGSADGVSYIAMELVDGKSLRDLLDGSPLPPRRGLDLAVQIAEGLAKAHAAGIVHRDLKPENVMISKDGFVKILDFGLAKLTEPEGTDRSNLPTVAPETTPGMIMGTAGYMSPEQASGQTVDFRSDQFSFGAIGYEMATGRKAFGRKTPAETLTAIIREEPDPVASVNPKVPAPVRWIVERCLAKDPDDRYASTKDLARDLRSVRDHLSEASSSSGVVTPASRRSGRGRIAAAAVLVALAGVAAGILLGRRTAKPPQPSFLRLTFRRGTIDSARFARDGQIVVMGASWDGLPKKAFSTSPGSPELSALSIPDAEVLAVSSSNELAVSLHHREVGPFVRAGTLARVSLSGGAPREILDDVQYADWAPNGEDLAVVRTVGGKGRIEYPIGKPIYETAGWISHARISPDGELVAFCDHPSIGDDSGSVAVVDRAGKRRTLSDGWSTVQGLAWAKGGKEIWFTATKSGNQRSVRAVSLSGAQRLVLPSPDVLILQDVGKNGRMLLGRDSYRSQILALTPVDAKERDLSAVDFSVVRGITPSGNRIFFDDTGEGASADGDVYIRETDGSPPVRLGQGLPAGISPDLSWIASIQGEGDNARLVLLPTKTGQPRTVPTGDLVLNRAAFLPDGKNLVVYAHRKGHSMQLFVVPIGGGDGRPITPEGTGVTQFCILPDGRSLVARAPEGNLAVYRIDGGAPQPIPQTTSLDFPVPGASDGKSVLVFGRSELPARIFRVDLASGRRELWKAITPSDSAGVQGISAFVTTPDGKAYAYNFIRTLSDLFLVEGLK